MNNNMSRAAVIFYKCNYVIYHQMIPAQPQIEIKSFYNMILYIKYI